MALQRSQSQIIGGENVEEGIDGTKKVEKEEKNLQGKKQAVEMMQK